MSIKNFVQTADRRLSYYPRHIVVLGAIGDGVIVAALLTVIYLIVR